MNRFIFIKSIATIIPLMTVLSGCAYQNIASTAKPNQANKETPVKSVVAAQSNQSDTSTKPITQCPHDADDLLNFDVENKSKKDIYVCCFAYIKKDLTLRWRWDKSPIKKISHNQKATIEIDYIPDPNDRKCTYGVLAVFETQAEAENATYELLDDRDKLDLDQLHLIKDKTVTIEVDKYGFKKEKFNYEFKKKTPLNDSETLQPLDFAVENNSGVPLYVVCFIYHPKEKKEIFDPWHYDKDEAIRIEPGKTQIIPVPKVYNQYNRIYMQGVLGIFESDEEQLAKDSTYELMDNNRKLKLGRLTDLDNKKVTIGVEQYGINDNFIDYVIKPIRKIQYSGKVE